MVMNTPTRTRIALAFALALPIPALLTAQTAPAPAPTDETVVLSPFTVSTDRDNGYTAVDSLAGGRQNAPIRVTPASMFSMTREFVNDLAITNVQDAWKWSLNTVPTAWRNGVSGASGGDVFNFWSVSIRGDAHVQGGNPPTKNYFPIFFVADTYNIDRIEFDSGPNSILFGVGDIGGVQAVYTKNALLGRNFEQLEGQTSSYGGFRGTVDANASPSNSVALRLNAFADNLKGWKDGDKRKNLGADLAGTIRFSPYTQIRFEAEGLKLQHTVFAQSFQDGVSLWDKNTTSPTWKAAIANADAAGVGQMNAWGGPEHYNVWTPSVGLMNWAGGARSKGTGDIAWGAYLRPYSFTFGPTGTTVVALPSRHFAVTPTDALLKQNVLDLTLNLEQRINDNAEFVISGYRYADDAKAKNFEGAGGGLGYGAAYDLNKQLPNGQPNPNFGKLYSDFFLDAQTQDHWVNEVRGQFSYHFDATVWNVPLKQLLSVSAGEQVTEYDARQYQATVMEDYDPNNWTQSMVWGRVYWDQAQRALSVPTTFNGKTIRYIPLPFNWYDFDSHQTIKYVGGFSQTRLWDDRLNISLGVRRDNVDTWKHGLRGTSNPLVSSSNSGTTYSAGLIGYVLPWLGVVANTSENFQPPAGGNAPSIFGKVFGPSFGKSKELGLRVSTKDGRYYASLLWYQDTSHDVIGGDSPDFQAIWNDYFTAGGTNTDIGPAGNVTGGPGTYHANMQYTDTYDVKYHGVEFSATASPNPNWRFQVSYSKPKGEKQNDGPNGHAYLAQHLSTWQAVASGTSDAAKKLASDLTNAQNLLTSTAVPTITAHLYEEKYNAVAAYTFTNTELKGLDLGLGVSYLGQQYGNPWDNVNGQRSKSPAYTLWSTWVGYARNFEYAGHKIHAKFQVNVDNLFGKDTLVWVNYQAYGNGKSEPMDYNLLAPRKFTFTARFEF